MEPKKIRKILEKAKQIEKLNNEILSDLRKEIFADEIEDEIIKVFEKTNNKLSLDDVVIKLWIYRGGLELKNKEDYYKNTEFFNLQNIVRDVIFDSLAEKDFLKIIRKEKKEKVIKLFFEKRNKTKNKKTTEE